MNLREIAKRAKVSIATASRIINQVPTVDPVLARRVRKVIEQVGYYPNTHARALVSGRSRIFGLMVSEITNPFFPEIVQTFENLGVEHNYEVCLSSIAQDPRRLQMAARRMMERRVDGVAILTFENEDSLMAGFCHQNVPVVAVDVDSPKPMGRTINIDYQHGIRQAVQHLAALGHTRIAFICGPRHLKTAVTRRLAFHECMKEIGLETSQALLVEGDHTLEAGMKGMSVLAALPDRPSAVICSNDLTAIGVMRQASELALGVPRDLSVVGFDDIRMAQFTTPPLTTVRLSQVEIANMAFSALLESTEPQGNRSSRPVYAIQTHLVLRRSTGMAPSRVSKTLLGRDARGRLGGEEAPRRFGPKSAFR